MAEQETTEGAESVPGKPKKAKPAKKGKAETKPKAKGSANAVEPGAGIDLLERRLSEKLGVQAVEFDPTIIIAIIMAVVQMLGKCPLPTPNKLRQRYGNQTALALYIREQMPKKTNRECAKLATSVFEMADKATDDELALLIEDARR